MSNLIKEIEKHENEACNYFEFSEVKAILQHEGELTEKLALAFTLGYMRRSENIRRLNHDGATKRNCNH